MSGFDNEVMYAPGERLQVSSAQDIARMQLTGTDVSRVNHTGDPNDGITGVAANPSSLSHDPSSGFLWLKVSGTGIPTWQRLFPSPTPPILSVLTANATPQFNLVGTTATVDFNLTNLALGSSLPALTVGTQNVAMGSGALASVTSGSTNVAIGFNAAAALTSGTNNVAIGQNSLIIGTTAVGSVGIGEGTLNHITTGQYNTAVGFDALGGNLSTGTQNTALGKVAGNNYTTSESSNIVIGNSGVTGESNVIRIGTAGGGLGQQSSAYLAGVTGVTVAGSAPVGVASTGQLSSLGFGTATQVLTSNGASNSPTWQPVSSSGAVITLSGNSGGAIPPDGTGTINVITANTTVKFVGAVNTLTQDFGLTNLIIGNSATALTSGTNNVGVGQNALRSVSSGGACTCIGDSAGQNISTGTNNTYIGLNAGSSTTTGQQNTAAGVGALLAYTSGSANQGRNTAIGYTTLDKLLTGIYNTCLGIAAGTNYTTNESSNICIENGGVVGESNTIRIGDQGVSAGQQNRAFVAGITGVTVAASAPVAVASTGQLSSLGFGTAAQVLTSNGAGVSPTWQPILPAGFPWLDASGAFAATSNTGYFLTAASTPTLPAAPSQGDIIEFFVDAAALCTITANTGQVIQYAGATSAAAGTVAASIVGNSVRLVYRSANTSWNAIASMGAAWTVT